MATAAAATAVGDRFFIAFGKVQQVMFRQVRDTHQQPEQQQQQVV
jgi:uncharacterized protein (DUF697 family)